MKRKNCIFSANLKKLRQINKLTQSEVYERTNIPKSTYRGYESGSSEATIGNVIKLANLFDVTIDALVTIEINESNIDSIRGIYRKINSCDRDLENRFKLLEDLDLIEKQYTNVLKDLEELPQKLKKIDSMIGELKKK